MGEVWLSGEVAAAAKHIYMVANLRVQEIRGGKSTHNGRELLTIK